MIDLSRKHFRIQQPVQYLMYAMSDVRPIWNTPDKNFMICSGRLPPVSSPPHLESQMSLLLAAAKD
jgi:hypothetical protein